MEIWHLWGRLRWGVGFCEALSCLWIQSTLTQWMPECLSLTMAVSGSLWEQCLSEQTWLTVPGGNRDCIEYLWLRALIKIGKYWYNNTLQCNYCCNQNTVAFCSFSFCRYLYTALQPPPPTHTHIYPSFGEKYTRKLKKTEIMASCLHSWSVKVFLDGY